MTAPNEILIHRIVRSIVRMSSEIGCTIPEALAAFLLKVVLQRPGEQPVRQLLCEAGSPTSADADSWLPRLAATCLQPVSPTNSPASQLLQMQLDHQINNRTREQVFCGHEEEANCRLASVIDDIFQFDVGKLGRDQLNLLHRKISVLAVLSHSLGDPSDAAAVNETCGALYSVVLPHQLRSLLSQSRQQRCRSLVEITDTVAGVRLFNKDCSVGGADIEDLPCLLSDTCKTLGERLQSEIEACCETANQFNTLLVKAVAPADVRGCVVCRCGQSSSLAPCDHQSEIQSDGVSFWREVALCRQIVAHHLQYKLYLQSLLSDVKLLSCEVRRLLVSLSQLLQNLHECIDNNITVPINSVFPLFVKLGRLWRVIQAETVYLNHINTRFSRLTSFMQLYKDNDTLHLSLLKSQTENVDSDPERQQCLCLSSSSCVESDSPSTQVLNVDCLKHADSIVYEYNGFCPVSMVTGNGALLVGDCRVGVVYYNYRYYCFSSEDCLNRFAADPERYSDVIESMVIFQPELVHLLQMEWHVGGTSSTAASCSSSTPSYHVPPTLLADTGVQTAIHPESALSTEADVEGYSWNEWNMRRQLITLADLHTRRTRSTQTRLSHLRRDNATQVYPPRGVECQTSRDCCSQCYTDNTYLQGLRGNRSAAFSIVPLSAHHTQSCTAGHQRFYKSH